MIDPDSTDPQDGAERLIESLSLIDAVMPDIVATRQQLAAQQQKPTVKTEATEAPQPNGEEPPPQPAAAAVDAMEVGQGRDDAGSEWRGGVPWRVECF